MDLYNASRDDLMRMVLEQRETIARQELLLARQQAELAGAQATAQQLAQRVGELAQRVRELEGRGPDRPQGLAGNKALPATPAAARAPRKKRPHNAARQRMTPTARVVHAVDRCPDCGVALGGGAVKRTREVIEVPRAPVAVTEHAYLERRCPWCRRHWTPPAELGGVVLGRQRLGVGLVSLIATLREEGRWPFRTIQWYLRAFYDLRLSVGALVGVVKRGAAHGADVVGRIRDQIRRSAVVNVDETGRREGGSNGYVWCFSTPEARYFARRGRGKGVLDEVLGDRFDGVLVSDLYAAYDHYPGVQQRCWAHLLRDVHDLRVRHPTDTALGPWAAGLRDLYARAVAYARDDADAPARRQAKRAFEGEALALCQPYLHAERAPQRVLCQRVAQYLPALFEFVLDPAIPATNNGAERAIRHFVTGRKISGGTRSEEGSDTKMGLATLFGTWRAEGRNPFTACYELLAAP